MHNILTLENLSCTRDDVCLFANFSLDVKPGEAVQILAPNGQGKTTLLRTIAGLRPACSGKIKNLLGSPPLYIGHKSCMHPSLTVYENLSFLNSLKEQSTNSIDVALSLLKIQDRKTKRCSNLSAGQLQRVNLAQLLLSSAKLWLLDEPFSNLDKDGNSILNDLIDGHLRNGGAAIIATHSILKLNSVNLCTIELENYA